MASTEITETHADKSFFSFKAFAGSVILVATSRNWRYWRDASGSINFSGILAFVAGMAAIFTVAAGVDFYRSRRLAASRPQSPNQITESSES